MVFTSGVALVGLAFVSFAVAAGASVRRLRKRRWRVRRVRELDQRIRADRLLRILYEMPFVGIAVRPVQSDHWFIANDCLCAMLGFSREEFLALRWQDVCHPEDIAPTQAANEQLRSGTVDSIELEKRFVRKNGADLPASVSIKTIRNADGEAEYYFSVIHDVTERKASEARIQRLTNVYAALGETSQAIVRSQDENDLFQQVCRFAVEFGGMRMAWVGMLDAASRQVAPVAHHGEGTDFLSQVIAKADADGDFPAGVVNRMLENGFPYWVDDYAHEESSKSWQMFAQACGWTSAACLPLFRCGKLAGVLMMFSHEKNAFDEQIRGLLTEMAQDVSYALTQFVKEARRLASEDQLRLSAKVFDQSAEAVVICDSEHRVLRVNRAFTAITGYGEQEIAGRDLDFLVSRGGEGHCGADLLATVSAEGRWQGEIVGQRKDGSLYPELLSISQVHDVQGRVSHDVCIFRDISELKASQESAQRLANFDALTGLPNRRLLEDRVGQAIGRVSRTGERVSLVFIDLDRFKNVNDSLGHHVGDQLLVQVAERLKATLREDDTVGRIGGDEFILVLPETGPKGSSHVAEKILHALGQPFHIGQYELIVTPSMGIAIYPNDGADYGTLSMCADVAMYRAKAAGRNTFRFFTKEMQDQSERALYLENALRRAIESGQLALHYQPQISLDNNRVIGVEALVRWIHPKLGVVSPSEFIPVAEDCGLILPIGEWVIRTALSQLKQWHRSGVEVLAPLVMAVNISAVQFLRGDFPATVARILAEIGMPPDCLELELTESVALGNPDEAIRLMGVLRAQGVRLSIDDFGTGYSSLSYLKRFHAYKLKIDKSFVRDISRDPDDKAIVEAIIGMARNLGMRTVAEGVETAEQMAFLYDRGCDEAQGYFIARPMPANEFEDFVRHFKLLG